MTSGVNEVWEVWLKNEKWNKDFRRPLDQLNQVWFYKEAN